jgi:hypothetical protein
MPHIRVYSHEMPLEQKRVVGQELISIALRAFQLRPEDRDKINVQFMPLRAADCSRYSADAAVLVEVSDQFLSAGRISDFVSAAREMLSNSPAVKPPSRIARWFGSEADPMRQIAFQFNNTGAQQEYVFGDRFAAIVGRKAA